MYLMHIFHKPGYRDPVIYQAGVHQLLPACEYCSGDVIQSLNWYLNCSQEDGFHHLISKMSIYFTKIEYQKTLRA